VASLPEKDPPPWGPSAVGVDDDLAPGEAGVRRRPSQAERAARVDVHHHACATTLRGRLEDVRGDRLGQGLLAAVPLRRVLGGEDQRLHLEGTAALVGHGD